MTDIVLVQNGKDLGLANSDIPKAVNVLAVQLGELEYQPTFGVDKKYFLFNGVEYQPESVKSYFVQRLVEAGINVTEVVDLFEKLYRMFTFRIKNQNENVKGLIR